MEGYGYKIIFADGCWYWGTSKYRGAPPEKDGYYGSPVTHKNKWSLPHAKIVVKIFYAEDQRLDYETNCILPDLGNPRCLNEHAGRAFSKETCIKGGRASAEKSRGVLRSSEVKEKISKALKGKKLTPEHVQKLKKAKRPPISAETISKRVASRKGYKHSEETRRKIGEGNKNKVRTQDEKEKIAGSVKGFKWYNNGEKNVQARIHPGEGWSEGRILDWAKPSNLGMRWYHKDGQLRMFKEDPGDGWTLGRPRAGGKRYYNNGTDHVLTQECPGEGWVLGRLSKK